MQAEVWLFFHKADRAFTRTHRDRVQDICRERGWTFQPRPIDTLKSPWGRPVPVIAQDVALGIYPRAHRHRVGTLILGRDPRVQLHPNTAEALKMKKLVPLRRYLAYKSFWSRLPFSDATNDSWVGSFEGWCGTADCEGEHDPRCLPFHVFDGDGRNLQVPTRRVEFDRQYGTGALRVDDRSASWKMEPAIFHGVDELHISGRKLRPGCHWDITADRYRISTPAGVWLIDGHVNIYPDAHVRGNRPSVKKLV